MKYSFLIICFLLVACKQESALKTNSKLHDVYLAPDELFGDLFKVVQQAHIFQDSKTFTDCTAKLPSDSILVLYHSEKQNPDFNLKQFVSRYFEIPNQTERQFKTDTTKNAVEHINTLWPVLTQYPDAAIPGSSLIALPKAYVIPGGRFREVYYWDSYFTMLGLAESEQFEVIESMLDNFTHLIDTLGHIPNGNRTYYVSRSQPPFFAEMIALLAKYKGESVFETYKASLRKEYEFWMQDDELKPVFNHVVQTEYGLMNRYFDCYNKPRQEAYAEDFLLAETNTSNPEIYRAVRAGAESGWDFSSRWFADGQHLKTIETLNIIPVDLNAILFGMESVLIKCYANEDPTFVTKLKWSHENRTQFLNRLSWNVTLGVFEDYNWYTNQTTGRLSLAMVYPLFFKMASQDQADAVASYIARHFLKPGGVVTTNAYTGQQWDAPNGWAPLQWLTVIGLENYGHYELANTIMSRWTTLNEAVYKNTGKFVEKYNVEDLSLKAGGGEYPVQDGFGWSNGVYLAFKKKLKPH